MLLKKWFLPLQLAWRFLFGRQQSAYVKLLVKICLVGICLGSLSLTLTLMVMSGFEQEVYHKARGMNSHALISGSQSLPLSWPHFKTELNEKGGDLVAAASAMATTQVIIDHGPNFYNLLLKAVDPVSFAAVSQLHQFITPHLEQTGCLLEQPRVPYKINLKRILSGNNVLLGHKVAKALKVGLGDKIKLLFPEVIKNRVKLKEVVAVVSGFIDVGFNEFDSGVLLCGLEFFWQINGNAGVVDYVLINFVNQQATGQWWQTIFNRLSPWAKDIETLQATELKQRFTGLQIQSWQELYPALISSMRLEKYAMFLVLFLISLVALMNMVALLVVQVQAKRRDIVILKVLGFSQRFICGLFTIFGLSITALASFAGALGALVLGHVFTYHLPIRLPDAYLVACLPFDLHPGNALLVFGLTVLVGFFAVWVPAKRAGNLSVVKVLKDL